jgi:hypothetical protein
MIPEAFLFVLAAYVFSRTKLNRKKYMVSAVLYGISGYLIRFLPIDYGVHTILSLIVLVLLSVKLNGISIIKSIRSAIAVILTMFVSEGINIAIIQFVLKKNINDIFANSMMKIIYGMPSLFIFGIVVYGYYLMTTSRYNNSKQLNESFTEI